MATHLLISKGQFQSELNLRIAEGNVILELASKEPDQWQFERLEKSYRIWNDYNKDWLKRSFSSASNEYTQQYETSSTMPKKLAFVRFGHDPSSLQYRQTFFTKDVSDKLEHLESLLARIDLIQATAQNAQDASPLAHLHPTVQQVAGGLWADKHFRQAVLDACIALDRTVQSKAGLPATITGKPLMTTAFSANEPLIRLSQDTNEQLGFMNLYQGSVQAIRNHYAHNLTEILAPRALEWLGFISALFYKLDEV